MVTTTKRRSSRKSNTRSCRAYNKTKSPICNKYKNCVWVPKQGCKYTTNKTQVMKQIKLYEKNMKTQTRKQKKAKKERASRRRLIGKEPDKSSTDSFDDEPGEDEEAKKLRR